MRQAFSVAATTSSALRALNYTPEVEAIRKRKGSGESVALSELLESMGPAYGAVFTRLDCEPSHGVELITQGDMFAAEPAGRVIRRDSMARPDRHLVKKWQVLISGAGTLGENELYGRAIIADDRLAGAYVGPHAMVLTFREPGGELALFTYAYLCTTVGIRAIRSTSFGTKILGIRKDILGALPVPVPDAVTLHKVASLIRHCVEQRETYLRELKAARKIIEDLPEMQEAHNMCGKRRRHAVVWNGTLPTVSAWTAASAGGALEFLKSKWKQSLVELLEEDGIFNGPRFARVICSPPHGIEFLTQRDAFLMKPIPRQIVHPGFRENLLFARNGTILVGGHGTLGEGEIFGKAILVHGRFSKSAFTQDLLRLVPKPGKEGELYAFLTTTVGFRLLRSTAVGTKILSMRPDLLAQLPVPLLSPNNCAKLNQHASASVIARQAAEDSENEAIRIIEEEVLPSWLT